MKKIVLLLLTFFTFNAFSQQKANKKTYLLKSTITSVGSSSVSKTISNKKKYKITQSIGQSGIIGKVEEKSTSVQQGFLTNNIFFKIDNSITESFKETLDFIISPNPFVDYLKIDFSKKTTYDVYIKIYDINGKIHYSKKYLASDKIVIPMKKFSIGNYLIQIKSGNIISTKKILKKEI